MFVALIKTTCMYESSHECYCDKDRAFESAPQKHVTPTSHTFHSREGITRQYGASCDTNPICQIFLACL